MYHRDGFRCAGKERDAESGLVFWGPRYFANDQAVAKQLIGDLQVPIGRAHGLPNTAEVGMAIEGAALGDGRGRGEKTAVNHNGNRKRG